MQSLSISANKSFMQKKKALSNLSIKHFFVWKMGGRDREE